MQLLSTARRAVLATLGGDGRPRLVPIAFAMADEGGAVVLYSALDEKPKTVSDVRQLARVKDIAARPAVSVLVDRWSEEWDELAWIRLDGTARLLEPAIAADAAEHGLALRLLRERYPQYASQRLHERPVIRIAVEHVARWSAEP